ncbi:MAG: HAD family hydrolase [Lachnospiraceae bacterium]|nr:HAD family hydrolase [Lachnospiraceae bacterium]
MKYTQIVFDIDGTLIDTEQAVLCSFQDTVKELTGKTLPLEEMAFCLGITGEDALKRISMENVPDALNLWIEKLNQCSHMMSLFKGIPELLEELRARGIKMGIVTSKTRVSFRNDFEPFKIKKYFTTVVCADDTREHKPMPGPLLKYMEVTGEPAGRLLYVGDSIYDRECAKSAGVDFAIAGWGSKGRVKEAEYCLENPLDLLDVL